MLSRLFRPKSEPITSARFADRRTAQPKRLRFGASRKLKRGSGGPAVGFLNLPFRETIARVLPWELERKDARYGPYRIIRSEEEFGEIDSWLNANADVVFIRSLFATCIAVGEHQSSPGVRTRLGELERRAKYDADKSALNDLAIEMEAVFRRLMGGLGIDSICAVPPSEPGKFCLPASLSSLLASRLGLNDLTERVRWRGCKPQLKDVDVDQKWQRLEAVGLDVDADLRGRNVMIVDDLYQSGATAHFVASKLQAAGAVELHCLAVVKSLGDTDNT